MKTIKKMLKKENEINRLCRDFLEYQKLYRTLRKIPWYREDYGLRLREIKKVLIENGVDL